MLAERRDRKGFVTARRLENAGRFLRHKRWHDQHRKHHILVTRASKNRPQERVVFVRPILARFGHQMPLRYRRLRYTGGEKKEEQSSHVAVHRL